MKTGVYKRRSGIKDSPHPRARIMGQPKSSDRMSLVHDRDNVKCNEDLLICIKNRLGIHLKNEIKYIGSGTFGAILSYSMDTGQSIVIKFIINDTILNEIDNPESSIRKEIDYTYEMGISDIGPKVLGTFHYSLSPGEVNNGYFPNLKRALEIISDEYDKGGYRNNVKNIINNENRLTAQCVIMEQYTMDCDNALNTDEFAPQEKLEIIRQMIERLREQSMVGLYCSDLKPGNYVVKRDNGRIVVRMIDFGADYCEKGNVYKLNRFKNNAYLPNTTFTYLEFFYISCFIQLFLIVGNTLVRNRYTEPVVYANVAPLIFNNDTSREFFAYNYNQRLAMLKHVLGSNTRDAAIIALFHYTNTYREDKLYREQHIIYIADTLENIRNVMMRIWNAK